MTESLARLQPGMPIIYGGNRVARVTSELADAFREGDRLVVVQDTGDLLHIPKNEWELVQDAVAGAADAFSLLGSVSDAQIDAFFEAMASRLEDDSVFAPIAEANAEDVERARRRDRSTTRLVLSDKMRSSMVDGLRLWASLDTGRGRVVETIEHDRWKVDQVRSGLGVVGFVFEGRPNVFADATGVLKSGNTVVFRIGSDALGTARAIMRHALIPALEDAGLPSRSVVLIDSQSHAAGWALFSDTRLGLAVARGSGTAVSQLGAVARQAGVPVSLHGTGGAWIVAGPSADAGVFSAAVYNSLDRKVCNTLNTTCIVADRAEELVPVFLDALDRAGKRRETASKLHVTSRARPHVPDGWFEQAAIARAEGLVTESRTDLIDDSKLGVEWEWEDSPEVTLTIVDTVDHAVDLFNTQSPRFVASLVSESEEEHKSFFSRIDSPFVGNGFTRWVDGQYALSRPELGLSNWQFGRLFGRGGILSGDSVNTIRIRATQEDPDIGR